MRSRIVRWSRIHGSLGHEHFLRRFRHCRVTLDEPVHRHHFVHLITNGKSMYQKIVTAVLAALFLAGLFTGCQQCDDPAGPDPTSGLPDLMYTFYQRDVASRIYTAKADGSGQRPWSTTSGYVTDNGLLMSSPRNGKVAFISGGEDVPTSLVVADLSGANAVVLDTDVEFDDVLYPVISPDGRKVVVTKHRQARTADVVIYDVATKSKTLLTDDIQSESQVFFTPITGEIVYYTSDDRIVAMRADGTNKRTLVSDAYSNNDYSCFLDFSPNGDRMVYMRKHPSIVRGADLAILELSTGQTTAFRTNDSMIHGLPAWSPDGAFIAFVQASVDDVKSALVIASVNGSGQDQLLINADGHWVQYPQWSPDGNYVSATVTMGSGPDNGVYSVRVVDVTSRTSTLIGTDLLLAYWVR